jgi:hypothetical protein
MKQKGKGELEEEGRSVAWCGQIPRQQNLEEKSNSPRELPDGARGWALPFASVFLASSSRSRELTGSRLLLNTSCLLS